MLMKCNLQGRRHKKKHRPCEDRLVVCEDEKYAIYGVADGHSCCCRAAMGARLACHAVVKALTAPGARPDEQAFRAIKRRYDQMIRRHLKHRPLRQEELENLLFLLPEDEYGTTLLAAYRDKETGAVTTWQLGDGGVFVMDAKGRFLKSPPSDPACQGVRTSSLCYEEKDAMNHLRMGHYDSAAAIILCTDGYEMNGSRPDGLARLLTAPDSAEEEFLPEVQSASRGGDDQTVILWADDQVIRTQEFQEGLAKTLEACRLSRQAMAQAGRLDQLNGCLSAAGRQLQQADSQRSQILYGAISDWKQEYDAVTARLAQVKEQIRELLKD